MRLTFELSDYSWIVRKLTGPATRSTFLIGFVKRRQIGFFKMASSPKFDERWLKGQNAQNLQREDKTYTLTLITSSPYFFEKFQRQFQESLANFCTCKKTGKSGVLFSDLQFAHHTNILRRDWDRDRDSKFRGTVPSRLLHIPDSTVILRISAFLKSSSTGFYSPSLYLRLKISQIILFFAILIILKCNIKFISVLIGIY